MSLINQMLRDLESRRSVPATAGAGVASMALAAERGTGTGSATMPRQRHVAAPMGGVSRWLVAVIVLLAVLLGLLLWSSQPPWQEQTAPANAIIETPVASMPVVQMTVEPVAPLAAEPLESAAFVEPVKPVKPVEAIKPAEAMPLVTAEKNATAAPSHESPILSPEPSAISPRLSVPKPVLPAEPEVSKRVRPLSNEQRAELALRRGVNLLGQGHQTEAEQALQASLQFDPRQRRARETLAALYFNSGRLGEAQTLLAEGLRLMPHATELAQFYARLLAEQGDLAGALVALLRARPPLVDNPDYYALLAALFQRAGQHAQAVQTYRDLLAHRKTAAPWRMGLAISLEAQGETTTALDAYVKAHQLGVGLDAPVLAYLAERIRALAPRVASMKQAAEAAKAEE